MTIPNTNKVYPRSNDYQTIYLKNVITRDYLLIHFQYFMRNGV
ncbi:MAG: virginiamycin A acetyltransferase [Clostridium sp.]|jgi:virginiamycin A acetyltransferase